MRAARLTWLLAAIAIAATPAAAARAETAHNPPIGVQAKVGGADPETIDRRFAKISEGGLQLVREDFKWSAVETRQGHYRWDAYDTVVGAAATHDLDLVATLTAPPAWATPSWNVAPTSGAALQHYAEFAREVVRRYGSDGGFWKANPQLPKRPIRFIEVWNEPYTGAFWANGYPDPGGYARMFRAVVEAARPADSEVKFMLQADLTAYGPDTPFAAEMFRSMPDLGRYVDIVSIHPYVGSGRSPEACAPSSGSSESWRRRYELCRVTDIRRILDENGATRARLWITEIGWSTASEASGTVSEQLQAQYVHDVFGLLRTKWNGLVDGVLWYAYTTPERSANEREDHFGLVHPDGRPKPAWSALSEEARRSGRPSGGSPPNPGTSAPGPVTPPPGHTPSASMGTVPSPAFPPPEPPVPPAGDTASAAGPLTVSVPRRVVLRGRRPTVSMRLVLPAPAGVNVELRRRGKLNARRKIRLRAGHRTFSLPVSRRSARGVSVLTLRIRYAGESRTIKRAIRFVR